MWHSDVQIVLECIVFFSSNSFIMITSTKRLIYEFVMIGRIEKKKKVFSECK